MTNGGGRDYVDSFITGNFRLFLHMKNRNVKAFAGFYLDDTVGEMESS